MSRTIRSVRPSRRALLGGLGASPLAALLGEPLVARAQSGVPKRFIVIHKPCGTVPSRFFPQGGSETSFTLPSITEPFAPLKDDLVFLSRVNAPREEDWPGDAHGGGMMTMMTGLRPIPLPGFDGNPDSHYLVGADRSIDQVLAAESPLLRGRPFPSLVLSPSRSSAEGQGLPGMRVLSYSGPGTRGGALWPETRVDHLVNQLFQGITPDGGASAGAAAAATRLQARRRSVLDHVRGDLARLAREIPASERPRLDEHAAALARLFDQLGGGDAPAGCARPSLTASGGNTQYATAVRHMFEIIRAALLCDRSRVVSLTLAHGNSPEGFHGLIPGVGSADGHHEISHALTDGGLPDMLAIERWYSERVADFLLSLKRTPEGDGSSMLDHTLVAYFTDVSDSQGHNETDMPVLLFGGKALGLRGGRNVQVGRAMPDVWVSVARAFGVQLERFGNPAYNRGPAPNLFQI